MPEADKQQKTSIKKEIIIIIISAVFIFLISSHFDLFERFVKFSRKHESYEIDEIFMLLVILSFSFIIFSVRRIIDLKKQISIRESAEKQIIQNLQEKEILLREINHRVKNNFQMITSLLSLQKYSIKDEKIVSLFEISENRIRAIAHVYDILNQSENMAKIEFGSLIKTLANEFYNLRLFSSNELEIIIDSDQIELDLNQSIPCALIINELVTNSIKHAFHKNTTCSPRIIIKMFQANNDVHLHISDNGCGFEEQAKDKTSLGLQIIDALVKQLKGKITWNSNNGTTWMLCFPKKIEI